jgi:diacylglycerol kinase
MVISFEMMNHALEKLSDAVHPEHHTLIKFSKDVSAAAVLWSTIISILIGIMILLPKLISIL